jgi:hypothetical protein
MFLLIETLNFIFAATSSTITMGWLSPPLTRIMIFCQTAIAPSQTRAQTGTTPAITPTSSTGKPILVGLNHRVRGDRDRNHDNLTTRQQAIVQSFKQEPKLKQELNLVQFMLLP